MRKLQWGAQCPLPQALQQQKWLYMIGLTVGTVVYTRLYNSRPLVSCIWSGFNYL